MVPLGQEGLHGGGNLLHAHQVLLDLLHDAALVLAQASVQVTAVREGLDGELGVSAYRVAVTW